MRVGRAYRVCFAVSFCAFQLVLKYHTLNKEPAGVKGKLTIGPTAMPSRGCITLVLQLSLLIVFTSATAPRERHLNKDIKESRAGHVKICDEKFAAVSSLHTACLQSPRRAHEGMSKETKDVVLGIHNYYREKVGKGDGQYTASDMQVMTWDHELAELAQRWASNCIYSHDNHKNRVIPGRFYVGQNIAWTSLYDWKFTMEAWHEEYKYFQYGYGPTMKNKRVGHYTQMVWASSTKLGCGYAFCNGTRHYYVCNYGPVANVEQHNDRNAMYRPYKVGPSLSSCPYNRKDGLCDCHGKVCLNGGTLDVATCTCHCVNRPWIDKTNNCALKCERARDVLMCGRIWGPEYCMKYINVPYQYCPVMCNWCPAKGGKHTPRIAAPTPRPTPIVSHKSSYNRGRYNQGRYNSRPRHNKSKSKAKPFGENELPLGDQPPRSTTTTSTTTSTTIFTTTTPYVASTTTTSSSSIAPTTTTNYPAEVETLPPACMKAERPICGQPHSVGFYPKRFCSNSRVRLTCPAMCGSCSASECVDYEGRRFQPGSSWLTDYGRVDCTTAGAKFTSGCVRDPTSPGGMFVHIGGTGIYRKDEYQYTCTCTKVGRKKKLSCLQKWVGSAGR